MVFQFAFNLISYYFEIFQQTIHFKFCKFIYDNSNI